MIMLSVGLRVNIKNILCYIYNDLFITKEITMGVNLPVVIVVAIIVVLLIVFIIKRNQKDKKKFEQEMIDEEIQPEKDDKENI